MQLDVPDESFRYLSITITKEIGNFLIANYDKLLKEIKEALERPEMLPLTIMRRIETVRMNTFTRLLFLFPLLPIQIPKKIF